MESVWSSVQEEDFKVHLMTVFYSRECFSTFHFREKVIEVILMLNVSLAGLGAQKNELLAGRPTLFGQSAPHPHHGHVMISPTWE